MDDSVELMCLFPGVAGVSAGKHGWVELYKEWVRPRAGGVLKEPNEREKNRKQGNPDTESKIGDST